MFSAFLDIGPNLLTAIGLVCSVLLNVWQAKGVSTAAKASAVQLTERNGGSTTRDQLDRIERYAAASAAAAEAAAASAAAAEAAAAEALAAAELDPLPPPDAVTP